jgi:hypothetical protein
VKRNGTKRYIFETKRNETNQNDNVPKPCYITWFFSWLNASLLIRRPLDWSSGHPGPKNTFFLIFFLPGDQKYQLANITNLLHESANLLVTAKPIPPIIINWLNLPIFILSVKHNVVFMTRDQLLEECI